MDPFTLAGGLQAMGGLFKGILSIFAGDNEAKAKKYAAQQAQDEAGVNAQIALQQGDQVAAQGAVQAAANGGGLVGSSLGVISQLSSQAMFNARAAVYRGNTEAQRDLYEGGVAKAQGLQGALGEFIDAGSSLAGGFAKSAANKSMMQSISMLGGGGGAAAGAGGLSELAGLF